MVNRIGVVAGFALVVLNAAPALCASKAEELFALTERIEAAQPWTLEKIERITGRKLEHGSFTTWSSVNKSDTLVKEISVDTNPLEPEPRRITAVSLYLSQKGLRITPSDISKKFGKWTEKQNRRLLGRDFSDKFGYGSIVSYVYKQKNRRWLVFDVDDDEARQLRSISILRQD